MGKLVLLLVAAVALTSAALLMSSRDGAQDTERRLAASNFEALSRIAAQVGEDVAVDKLADAFASTTFSGTHDDVPYQVDAQVTGNRVVILSRGSTMLDAESQIDYTIRSEYDRVLSSNIREQVPPFMQYAFITEEDLELKGTVSGDVYAAGFTDNVLNADMHTNGDLSINGIGSERVNGHGTYVGTASAGQDRHFDLVFDPYFFKEESEDKSVYRTSRVEIPPLSLNYLETTNTLVINSDVYVPVTAALLPDPNGNGGVLFSDAVLDATNPSRDHPAIYYVGGDLTFTSDVTIPAYSLFIINGDVDFGNKQIKADSSSYAGGDESALGFYASGAMYMQGQAEVWAQIYSQGGATIGGGNPVLYGNLATRGSISFTGTLDVIYREASPALTVIWDGDPVTKLRRLAYTEW